MAGGRNDENTCFRGGGTKACTGVRAAEYGTISELNACNRVVRRTPKLESNLCPPTCAIRVGAVGRMGRSPNIGASAGQRESEPITCSRLGPGSAARTSSLRCRRGARTFRAQLIRAQAASDAPRRLLRLRRGCAETRRPRTSLTRGIHRSPVLCIALSLLMTRCLSVFPELVRVCLSLL